MVVSLLSSVQQRWLQTAGGCSCSSSHSSRSTHSVVVVPLGPRISVSGRSNMICDVLSCPERALAAASW